MQARKRHFDENVPDDVQGVLDISAVLGISEFRLFEIAYRLWFGRSGDEATIEGYFTPYMFNDVVPPWVRHFVARARESQSRGRLDPADFGIPRRHASAEDIKRGRLFALTLASAMIILLLLARLAADKYCLFPPCY